MTDKHTMSFYIQKDTFSFVDSVLGLCESWALNFVRTESSLKKMLGCKESHHLSFVFPPNTFSKPETAKSSCKASSYERASWPHYSVKTKRVKWMCLVSESSLSLASTYSLLSRSTMTTQRYKKSKSSFLKIPAFPELLVKGFVS